MSVAPFCLAENAADLAPGASFLAALPTGIASEDALHEALAAALRFPDWYGGNWDALSDCLRTLEGIAERRVVLFHPELPQVENERLSIYLDVLDESVRSWRDDGTHELVVAFPPDAAERIRSLRRG